MARSGIPWIDAVFDWCVYLLVDIASWLGITYEEINVWLFVIIGPALLSVSVSLNIYFALRNNESKVVSFPAKGYE